MISETTLPERLRIGIKRVMSIVFAGLGGFHFYRLLSGPSVTVIVYHRIIDDEYEGVAPYISVRKSRLQEHIRLFAKWYTVIPLEEAVDRIRNRRVDKKYLVITFDDGYRDFYSLGQEIFLREGVQPTVFVTTDCVDHGVPLWPDRVREAVFGAKLTAPVRLPELNLVIRPTVGGRIKAVKSVIAHLKDMDLRNRRAFLTAFEERLGAKRQSSRVMLSWDEVRELRSKGMSIGSHTQSHPILSRIDNVTAKEEIKRSKETLERETGKGISIFAYPNGTSVDFTETHIQQLVDCGYQGAVTTERGHNRQGGDPFRLRRTGVYLTDTTSDIKLKLAIESLF